MKLFKKLSKIFPGNTEPQIQEELRSLYSRYLDLEINRDAGLGN